MNDTIAALSAALHTEADAVRVISLNVANTQTPAYRRQIPVQASFADTAAAQGVPHLGTAVDTRAGTLKSASGQLNLAIEGKGFFVVSTGQGEVLTRRGDFRLDADGRIVTQDGNPLLGASGAISVQDQLPT